jgi:hypothetical protein
MPAATVSSAKAPATMKAITTNAPLIAWIPAVDWPGILRIIMAVQLGKLLAPIRQASGSQALFRNSLQNDANEPFSFRCKNSSSVI